MSYGRRIVSRLLLIGLIGGALALSAGILVSVHTSQEAYRNAATKPTTTATPFPVGVDPRRATITEQMNVPEFYEQNYAAADAANNSWWNKLANRLQRNYAFQQLASSVSRVIVVWPGERTEEAAKNVGDVLRWDSEERARFAALMAENEYDFDQGFIVPGQYISHRYATPEDIARLLTESFQSEVGQRYTPAVSAQVPLDEALIIASLIEREASDFENMREISGVIWNRLFIDMPLQLDASLQYVKAENPYEPSWWPAVRPADKFTDSPFNTYQNEGLPPAPIANPSVAAIIATLNPIVTDCLYYFHSRTRDYYCSETYPEHVNKLEAVYGQGR